MVNIFNKQKEFMVACNQNVGDVTEENNYNEFFLWSKLINEEHAELSEAILNSFNINRLYKNTYSASSFGCG